MLRKTCLTICPKTPDELSQFLERYEGIHELIEIRIDALNVVDEGTAQLIRQLSKKYKNQQLLLTFRPEDQGGFSDPSLLERINFWKNELPSCLVDLEQDLFDTDFPSAKGVVRSFHNFETSKTEVPESNTDEIVKIAVAAQEPFDALDLWRTFTNSKDPLIPIAMGVAGVWTRVLGPAFGAPWTYVAASDSEKAAPGQLSSADAHMYRIDQLTPETEVFGIVGRPVSHSLSPRMHNAAFQQNEIDAVYIPFDTGDLKSFVDETLKSDSPPFLLKGLSVTAPHKTAIIEHLDFIDETSKQVGAVNTVQKLEEGLLGTNTDVAGFLDPLKLLFSSLEGMRFALIGSGGAARACAYGLIKEGADVLIASRNEQTREQLAKDFDCETIDLARLETAKDRVDVIVNTTPVGTKTSPQEEPIIEVEKYKNLQLAYDLVYNPIETPFLLSAKRQNIPTLGGLAMLVSQGALQFEQWAGVKAPLELMSRAALSGIKQNQ